jgi:hypothetical protein
MKTALMIFAAAVMAATGQTNDNVVAGGGGIGGCTNLYTEIHIVTNVYVYQLETNYWYGTTTNGLYDNYAIEEMREHGVTNIVKTLAEAGEVCKVYGHSWRDGRRGEGEGSPFGGWYADYHTGIIYRTCRICRICTNITQ